MFSPVRRSQMGGAGRNPSADTTDRNHHDSRYDILYNFETAKCTRGVSKLYRRRTLYSNTS